MTVFEVIILVAGILLAIEVIMVILARACRSVFDVKELELERCTTQQNRQEPTFITGVGKINNTGSKS